MSATFPAVAATLNTEDGPFSVIAANAVVLAAGWSADLATLNSLVHKSIRPDFASLEMLDPSSTDERIAPALAAVRDYYAGDLKAPARIAVHQVSGEFRTAAWEVLRQVEAGHCLSYTEYAARAQRPAAVRAAASACAMNAAALFVPCHRIRRSDGTLGGFRYGLEIKRSLLIREGFLAD